MLKQEQIDYSCRRIPKEGVERINMVSFVAKEMKDYQGAVWNNWRLFLANHLNCSADLKYLLQYFCH